MSRKKVSVVITSYNQKLYLMEAVDSVLEQTYPVHEIIVADDGSTDGSVEVVKDLMHKYPDRIIGVLNPRNQGIPKNRNTGLERVTGEYVYILDGDDRFLPQNVECMLDFLERNPDFQCVYSNLKFIDSEDRLLFLRYQDDQPSGEIFFEIALGKFGILRNMIINYALLRQVGFMDERFPRYDGFELTVRLAKQGRIGYISEPLAEFRVYPNSDSKGLKARDHLNDLDGIYTKMKPLLKDLSRTQKKAMSKVWSERLRKYFVEDFKENARGFQFRFLRFALLRRGYLKPLDFLTPLGRDSHQPTEKN